MSNVLHGSEMWIFIGSELDSNFSVRATFRPNKQYLEREKVVVVVVVVVVVIDVVVGVVIDDIAVTVTVTVTVTVVTVIDGVILL